MKLVLVAMVIGSCIKFLKKPILEILLEIILLKSSSQTKVPQRVKQFLQFINGLRETLTPIYKLTKNRKK